jgi:predicted SAM-dependent methyltransferase
MPISFKRKLTSYSRIQQAVSKLIRGSAGFINKKAIAKKVLLNVGCGPNMFEQFINLDYQWTPKIDICWDITKKPYPIDSSSLEGIFTEHCLEHIPFEACERNINEFFRMLKPGGTVRIVVPDGEIYLDIYQKRKQGEKIYMPYEAEGDYPTPMSRINGIFRNHGHLFIYDFETFSYLLNKAGFKNIKKETFAHGRDKRLLIDMKWRSDESLYVEATR